MSHSHDDFSRTPVTGSSLRPWWYLLIIETGVLISIPLFVIGGQLGVGLTLHDLILATILGGAILGVLGLLTARIGAVTRCSTALLARATFGSKGAACIALLLALGMTGWWAVQLEMFATAVVALSHKLFGVSIGREFMIGVSGLAMITTAALGIRAIGKLAYLAVPLLIAGLYYGCSTLLSSGGMHAAIVYQPPAKIALDFGAAVATVVGGWILGASMNMDYSRFARNTKHAITYALAHYSFNYPLLMIICGVMAIGFGTQDIMQQLVPRNYEWILLLLMMLATWAANDCNLYSSSLGLTAVTRFDRAKLAIAAGLFGIILAELRLAEHMVSFLCLLGVFIAPISGVFIANARDPRDPDNPNLLLPVPSWRVAPMLAWICGATFGLATTPRESLGFGLLKLSTIPALDAVLVAGAIMFTLKQCLALRTKLDSVKLSTARKEVLNEIRS